MELVVDSTTVDVEDSTMDVAVSVVVELPPEAAVVAKVPLLPLPELRCLKIDTFATGLDHLPRPVGLLYHCEADVP